MPQAPTEMNANVITHPLFGTDPNQNQNGYSDYSGGASGVPTPPNANVPYQGTFMTPQLPPQSSQPAFQTNPVSMRYFQCNSKYLLAPSY